MKISKCERFILYPLAAVLLTLFAFYDLPIMQTLFDTHNAFGRMGELGGEIPLQLLGVVCGFWLFRFRDTSSKSRSFWWGVLFIVIALFFACYGGGQIYSYLNNKDNTYTFHPGIWFAAPVAAIYLGIGALIAFKSQVSSPKEAVIFAIYFLVLYASTWILMNILKFCWARPRWRHLVVQYGASADDYFKPWYQLNCNGHFSDITASFPSGHTMNALCWIVLAGGSSFLDRLKGKEWIIRLFVYVWAALVAFSRTIMGAHFPSDTTAGFVIELLLFDLLGQFFFPWFHAKLLNRLGQDEKPIKTAAN